ncbi:hypothetical protein [Pseudomonas azerbaijanorientalis]|uniref:hypothetical protein n=1 Tax=Pseudomonas azerbaijanorientalis TaxID=2842350 RepID=UPI001C3C7B2E|nr:hypothetical protein [Pseudomonas azerbaijanorientalis]QXH59359.1 hypothetical protein KSS91_14440 [Pseudomonas azerbaijanorientalis]
MSFLKSIIAGIKALFSSQESEHSEPLLPKIDPEKLKKELKILEIAQAHGAAGIPASNDTQLTDVEHQIRGTLGKKREATVKYGQQVIRQIQHRMDSIDITREINRTIQQGEEFERTADQILSAQDGRRKEAEREAKSKKALLDAFRTDNRLPDTPAERINSDGKLFKIAMLAACCVAEGFVNANFFASGMAGGLVDGFFLAFTLSLLNILVCFWAGRIYTNKNHVKVSRTVLGYFSGVVGLCFTFVLGVVVAYCRYSLPLLEEGTQSPIVLITQSFKAHIIPFQDFESCALFAVTIICGVFAIIEGYIFTDRYPGYAKVYSAYAESHRRYVGLVASLRKSLDDQKNRTLQLIDENVKKAEGDIKVFKYNMGQKSIIKKKVTESLVMADETLKALTQYYRYENRLKRPQGSPRPDYFDQPIEFPDVEMPDFAIDHDEARLLVQERLLSDMIENLEPIRARVQSSFTSKFDQLQPLQSSM